MNIGSYLFGPLTRLGLWAALITAALDQALKLWLLFVYDLGGRGRVPLGRFVDLVLTWNTGISYGLFRQEGFSGQLILLAIESINRRRLNPEGQGA